MTVRTRFAPSPTGFLHIGGAIPDGMSWLDLQHDQGSSYQTPRVDHYREVNGLTFKENCPDLTGALRL